MRLDKSKLLYISLLFFLSILLFEGFHKITTLSKNNEEAIVLTIGDSYAEEQNNIDTFSHHLKTILDESNKDSTVYKLTREADNTANTKRRLEKFIQKIDKKIIKKPNHIIIMVGSSDIYGLNFEPNVDDEDLEIINSEKRSWIQSLKIFKIYNNLNFSMFSINDGKDNTENIFKTYTSLYEQVIDGFNPNTGKFSIKKHVPNIDKEIIGENISIKEYFKKLNFLSYKLNNESNLTKLLFRFLNDTQTYVFTSKEKFFKFYTISFIENFRFQTELSHKDILGSLEKIKKQNPKINNNRNFQKFHKLFLKWNEELSNLESKQIKHWVDMIELCRKYKINIAAITLPKKYKKMNNLLMAIGKHQNMDIIDVYGPIESIPNYRKFFIAEGLAKNKGHRLIANYVAEYINNKKLSK
jgi:hypothetical protein